MCIESRCIRGFAKIIIPPLHFARVGDPVGSGLVNALSRPGGNLTGTSPLTTTDLAAKRLELLITAVPDAKRVGVLWDPSYAPSVAECKARVGPA